CHLKNKRQAHHKEVKFVAKKSLIVKQQRPQKFKVREYTRCKRCGRPHSVIRKFELCRVCFRELAHKGQIPGVRKASWRSEERRVGKECKYRRRAEGDDKSDRPVHGDA